MKKIVMVPIRSNFNSIVQSQPLPRLGTGLASSLLFYVLVLKLTER